MKQLVNHLKHNFLLYILLIFAGYLFFYHLGYATVTSWDEGWYGSIAREIVKGKDIFHLMWDGRPYYDHPPMGFWLMAITYKIFGISEFTTRLPSAISGIFTIFLIYQTARELFKKKSIAFASSLIMLTSVWYVIRVRSGNLDALFILFYIMTIYFSVRASKRFSFFPYAMLSFGALVLTKTLVGFSAVILIAYLIAPKLMKIKENGKHLFIGIFLFSLLVLPWYVVNYYSYSDFIQHHFFTIGTRDKTLASYFHLLYQQPLFYIHMGIRKWYYFWPLSLALLVISFRFIKRNVFLVLLWNFVVLYPFLTATQTELWHLIPVYVPIAFIIPAGMNVGMEFVISVLKKLTSHVQLLNKLRYKNILEVLYVIFFLLIAFLQFKTFQHEVIPGYVYIPDDVDISRKVSRYGNNHVFLDDDFLPLAVYYSNIDIQELRDKPINMNTLVKLFQSNEKNFLVITRNWAVGELKNQNIPFRVVDKNNSFSILARPILWK